MDARLVIVGGKANKREVVLNLPTIIGRSREAGLTIAHPMVSRQHCELFEDNGVLMVRDLGSLNGTFVRKQRIAEAAPLLPNEEFTVGPLTFRAEYDYVGEIATAATVPRPEQPPRFPSPGAGPELGTERQDQPEPPWLEAPAPTGTEAGVEFPDFAAWDEAQAGQAAAPPAESPSWPEGQVGTDGADSARDGAAGPGSPTRPAAAPASDQPQGEFTLGPTAPDLDAPPGAAPSGPLPPGPASPAEEEELDDYFKNLS